MQTTHCAPVAYKVTEFYNNDAGEMQENEGCISTVG